MAWHDQRLGTPGDIWGHHVDSSGVLVPITVPWFAAEYRAGVLEVTWRLNDDPLGDWQVARSVGSEDGFSSLTSAVVQGTAGEYRLRDPDVRPGQRYGYRVHGPWDPGRGARCNASKLLLDPYAKAIAGGSASVRVLDDTGRLFSRRGSSWTLVATDIRVLAGQQGTTS